MSGLGNANTQTQYQEKKSPVTKRTGPMTQPDSVHPVVASPALAPAQPPDQPNPVGQSRPQTRRKVSRSDAVDPLQVLSDTVAPGGADGGMASDSSVGFVADDFQADSLWGSAPTEGDLLLAQANVVGTPTVVAASGAAPAAAAVSSGIVVFAPTVAVVGIATTTIADLGQAASLIRGG